MRFAFTDEQAMFRDTIRDLFADLCPPEAVRAYTQGDARRVEGLWAALAEIGVLAALAPRDSGGLGMNEVDLIRILEEAGYAAVPEPLMEHAAVAVPALASAGSDLLEPALTGQSTVTCALETGPVVAGLVVDAIVAQVGDDLLAAVTSWDAAPLSSIDGSRRLGEVTFDGSAPLIGADAVLASDRAVLGTAAQCIGVARRLLDATVEFTTQRHQFGKPVGSYQAVKHHLADVRIGIEFAAPLVYRAAWSVSRPTLGADTRGRDVSMAKAAASDAVDRACRGALQCHGAIGYTYEYDLQLWLKRGWVLSAAYGDARRHRKRVAESLGI